jgi:hypothetical protein
MIAFNVFKVEKGEPIIIQAPGQIFEMKPTECHIKPDGDINDGPSLCFVLERLGSPKIVIGQISVKMFMPVIEELKKMGAI